MDATAVSAARGLAVPRVERRHVATVAVFFGASQALMPLVGWALGDALGPAVEAWAHWIAAALLVAIGARMIYGAGDVDDAPRAGDPFDLRTMAALALATSIDAFAAGMSLPLLGAPLVLSVVTIGAITAALSVAGLYAGRLLGGAFGAALGGHLERLGGLVLIALGARVLIERAGWLAG